MKTKFVHSLGTDKQTLNKRNPQRQGRKPAPTLLHGRRHDSDVTSVILKAELSKLPVDSNV